MDAAAEVAIVVGASAGIGEALATELAARGTRVALVARREAELARVRAAIGAERARTYQHDVQQTEAAEGLFARIEQEMGPVTALYFVAGILLPVELDEFDTNKDVATFAVNTLGGIAWVNAAARRFLPRKRGLIVGVCSVAGDRGRIGRPGYCASKAGLDCFLESIRNRLWRHGVQVTTIRPGFVATAMIAGAKVPERGLLRPVPAAACAQGILAAVARKTAIAYVPARWRLVMGVLKAIPSCVFRKLSV